MSIFLDGYTSRLFQQQNETQAQFHTQLYYLFDLQQEKSDSTLTLSSGKC
jgi:hypothetical protein